MTTFKGEIHPVAELFPMMSAGELSELAADIKEHGQQQPITLDVEHRLLDGRNRLAACQQAGVEPTFTYYLGDGPVSFIISQNLHRRHLTPSQKATLGARLLPELQIEAKHRQVEAGRNYGESHPKSLDSIDTDLSNDASRQGRSRVIAGRTVGVSASSVQRAKRLQDARPDLFEQVEKGERTLWSALVEAGLEKAKEQKAPKADRTKEGTAARNERVRQMAIEGYRPAAIAEVVGISEGNVRTKLHTWGIKTVEQRVGKAVRIEANRVMESLLASIEPLEVTLNTIYGNWDDLDRERFEDWRSSLSASIKAYTQLKNKLNKEIIQE